MRKITSLLTLLLLMVSGVNVWGQLPESLELTTDKENPKYYHITSVRTTGGTYLKYNGDGAAPTRVANAEAAELDGYWYLMQGSSENTYKIYSVSGTALTHNFRFTTDGSEWFIKTNQYRSGAYTISKTENVASGSNCIDAHNYDGGIGWWNSTSNDSEGTAWKFEKTEFPSDFSQNINTLKATVSNSKLINQNIDASYVGFMNSEQTNKLQQALTDIEGKSSYQEYKAFEKTIKEIMAPNFETGALYLIKNANSDKGVTKRYPSTQNMHSNTNGVFGTDNNNDRVIRRVDENAPLLPRLWKFEKQTDGKYKIRNANTGCNWSSYVDDGIDMPINTTNGGNYSIDFVPCNAKTEGVAGFNATFIISIDNHKINAYQGDGTDLLKDYTGNHIGDAGNYWYFQKVTKIPVTIGATGWASICLPCAVTLPEGVTAYTAESIKDNVITLSEVTGKEIPANCGVLLTANQGNYELTITTASTAEITNNLFKGANTKRLGFEVGGTFGLAANNNSAVFKKNKLKGNNDKGYVPANKAYILTSDLGAAAQGAALLSLDFGGATTGIEGVQAEDNKEVIYFDLNGRRVMNPAHGVFVTNTGKKVFIR